MDAKTRAESKSRIIELDGIRGLAALSVFCSHIVGALPDEPVINAVRASPLSALWGGASAVLLFFVLSGFVLSRPFLAGASRLYYGKFVVLRIFRIYPAYLFALVLAAIAISAFDPRGMTRLSAWVQGYYQNGLRPLSVGSIIRHILFIPKFDTHLLDPPIWTLIIEMRASFMIPIVIAPMLLSRSWPTRIVVMVIVVALSCVNALHYLPAFALGILLAKYWSGIGTSLRARPTLTWLSLIGGCYLYGNHYFLRDGKPDSFSEFLCIIGSATLMAAAVNLPAASRLLSSSLVQFLGRVSYSLYLLHFPILFLSLSRLSQHIGFLGATAVAIAATLLLSELSYRLIEMPMVDLGKKLAGRVAGLEASFVGRARILLAQRSPA